MPTVAIASEFLDAYARIPRAQQRKVREFTEKFRSNPGAASINYEKIHGVRDEKVRTVRIDQKYRAVVLHPEQGDVYVLVWVDNHDEAMAWAARKDFDINPVTGALQVVGVDEAERAVTMDGGDGRSPGLLDRFSDDVLLSFAVPTILLPAVRGIRTPEEMLSLCRHIPAEAAEALTWLAEGVPLSEVREALPAATRRGRFDPSDLSAALAHPDSRRRFVTLHSDDELTTILDAPLEKWRVFLHPSQDRLVTRAFNGPARVLGGAGTGKTVVAMHRARHLASTACPGGDDRILFTTYTANLAEDVRDNFNGLCGDLGGRIEVLHLHAWAARYLKSRGIDISIATDEEIDRYWRSALAGTGTTEFDAAFLRAEWDWVVQANGIRDLADYLQVPRTGRGRTLTRPQRGRAWQVFEAFRAALRAHGKSDWSGLIRDARLHIEANGPKLPYKAVIVDEAQDFHAEEWRLIRALVPEGPDDLFLVGDAHQRIYGRKVVLAQCGIPIQGRSSRLRINYRTTEQIRAWATAVLRNPEVDDLDGGRDEGQGDKSLLSGPAPDVRQFASRRAEREFLARTLKELLDDRRPEDICLVARTAKLVSDEYQPLLEAEQIPYAVLDRGGDRGAPGVRLATMHRVKGLEFPVMILAGVNAGVIPSRRASAGDDSVGRAEHEEKERSLLFVAATRARDRLIVTSYGQPSPFLSVGSNPS
jgi:UvrD/REP helicase N-terminal domain/UvrD-like helicase C-terminal domain